MNNFGPNGVVGDLIGLGAGIYGARNAGFELIKRSNSRNGMCQEFETKLVKQLD
jgi:hypothetical protein